MEIGEKSSLNILNKLLNASLEPKPLELTGHQLVTGHDRITLEGMMKKCNCIISNTS